MAIEKKKGRSSVKTPGEIIKKPVTPSKPQKSAPSTPVAATPAKKGKEPIKKIDAKSKGIHKKGKKGPKGAEPQKDGEKKAHKKNRYQRFQNKLNTAPRSPLTCARALKAEQELNQSKGRVFHVRLPDPLVTLDEIKSWAPSIESALFPKPIEPRSFMLVFKPETKDIKKEIELLKKSVKFGGKKIEIEEKRETKTDEKSADLIDPYTLYVTNLDVNVTKEDLKGLFPKAKTVLNPRKHNPRVQGGGSGTKFAFVSFESADEALAAFKHSFNKVFKEGKGVVVRFRRVARAEANTNAAQASVAHPSVPKVKVKEDIKVEGVKKIEKEEDEEDDSEEMEVEEDEDEEEDDSDDGLEEDDDDDE